MERPKEQMTKIEYENRFLDDERWREYIGEYISFAKNGGARESRKKTCLNICKREYPNLDNAQAEKLVEQQCSGYLFGRIRSYCSASSGKS